jgi:hypothetical protein
MTRIYSISLVCLVLYIIFITPFTRYLHNKPFAEKVGFVPSVVVLKSIAADHKELVAELLVLKSLMYYGGAIENNINHEIIQPDYTSISRLLHSSVELDPYNMDGYYFAQSILVWDMSQYIEANEILKYGMKFRTWDWYLPFSAGFNYAYFLKDFKNAAAMYMQAGEISGDPMFARLAGKYLQQSGQTSAAIAYLEIMAKEAHDQTLNNIFQIRIKALKEVEKIEKARDQYLFDTKRLPIGVTELIDRGYLKKYPTDPYGGKFILDANGNVTSTSKFAFAHPKSDH